MTDKNLMIKIYEPKFLNELEVIIEKIIAVNSFKTNLVCPELDTSNFYLLAFELSSEFEKQYQKFKTTYKTNTEALNTSRIRAVKLKNKIKMLNPNFDFYSELVSNSKTYKNSITFHLKPIFEYESNKKQNIDEILDNFHTFIINTEILSNFDYCSAILDKIEKIDSKTENGLHLSIFDLLKKSSLTKKLKNEPNLETLKNYQTIKKHKKSLLTIRSDVKGLKDEYGKSLIDYYAQNQTFELDIIEQKRKMKLNLENASYENLRLKFATLFKNNLDYLNCFATNTIPVFLHNIDTYLKNVCNNKKVIDIINRSLFDFDNTLEFFNIAESNFDSRKKLASPDWCPVIDSSALVFVDQNNPPKNMKFASGLPYIDISITPYSKLSTDLQYPEYKKALEMQKNNNLN